VALDAHKEQIRLKFLSEGQKRFQQQLGRLNRQHHALEGKTDKASRRKSAVLAGQMKAVRNRLDINTKALGVAQNQYYTASGQYDKLLSGANRDAFMALESVFKQYGLGSLAGKIYDYVKNGYSSDTISILLQDTKEYKTRFAANEARVKAGLPVLSPADYINTENSYRQLLRASGLPAGFYDSSSDFTGWIAKDVSPTEIQSRLDLATQATALASPFYKQALNQLGIDDGHLAAHFLDSAKALPLLQKAAATAQIGAAALQQGLTFNKTYAEQLATTGVTADQAQQGYSQVANELQSMKELGNIYGSAWTQTESEGSVFGTDAAATAQKAGLITREKGSFSGASGAARGGLAQSGGAK
jgi:hypothetical protein